MTIDPRPLPLLREATRFTATVRHLDGAPDVAQLVELRSGDVIVAQGRDAALSVITRSLARGERVELVPSVRVVAETSDEAVGLRAAGLRDPTAGVAASLMLEVATPQDMHQLGLRLDRPVKRRAREAYAALLGVDPGDLRGSEDGGAWRWYVSDRTVRWAPQEGAPWALRWKTKRGACPTPRELWERLASRSVLPMDWVGSAAREFREAPTRGAKVVTMDTPVTMHSALLLAGDIDGMVSAEALMREAASALSPWGAPNPARIRWSTVGEGVRWYEDAGAPVIPSALDDLVERTADAKARRRPFLVALERAADVHYSGSFVAQRLVELHLAWRQWCAEDRVVPERLEDWPATRDSRPSWRPPRAGGGAFGRGRLDELAGRRFRDLIDPTGPLLAVVSLGYAPNSVTAEAATICYRIR